MKHGVIASVMVLSSWLGLAKPAAAQVLDGIGDDTITAANEADVSIVDLLGAMATTRLPARQYLISVGELEPPPPPAPVFGIWDKLAQCESNGRWTANTGNGYFGGLQFDLPSWRAAGGAGRPDQASRAEQIRVAINWQARAGWKAWPVCSHVIGVR